MISLKHAIASAMICIFMATPCLSSPVPRGEYGHTPSWISARQAAADAAATADTLKRQARTVREQVRAAVRARPALAAELVRLAFHDAYTVDPASSTGGCNGSIRRELGRGENSGLQAAVNELTRIQRAAGLGWGDMIAVAGAEAVESSGGPRIGLRLGRQESDGQDPTGILPSGGSTLSFLRNSFTSRGFSDRDLVALSGAHTLGNAFGAQFVSDPNQFQNE